MSAEIHSTANKVVEQFKQELDNKTRSALSSNDYEKLGSLIAAAIAYERTSNAELLERIAAKIKSGVKKFDLDL